MRPAGGMTQSQSRTRRGAGLWGAGVARVRGAADTRDIIALAA